MDSNHPVIHPCSRIVRGISLLLAGALLISVCPLLAGPPVAPTADSAVAYEYLIFATTDDLVKYASTLPFDKAWESQRPNGIGPSFNRLGRNHWEFVPFQDRERAILYMFRRPIKPLIPPVAKGVP